MKIKTLMTTELVTVQMDDPLSLVKDIFDNAKFHHLLVVENGSLFGVISDRDLLKALSPNIDTIAATTKDMACLDKKVHQIMTRKPISIGQNASIKEAVDIFNENKISCIPVVGEGNKAIGILSWRDIMQALGDHFNQRSV